MGVRGVRGKMEGGKAQEGGEVLEGSGKAGIQVQR